MKVLCQNTWKKRIGSILLCWCILLTQIQMPGYVSAEENETMQYSEDAGVQTAAEETGALPDTTVPESEVPQPEISAPESETPQPEISAPEPEVPQPGNPAHDSDAETEGETVDGTEDSGQTPTETETDVPFIDAIEVVTESTPDETEGETEEPIEETESETEESETESETEYQAAQWDAMNGAYAITSVEELQWYGQNGAGKNAYLTNDLQIAAVSGMSDGWEPIEISGNALLDGKNHTIELYLTYSNAEADAAQIGLFAAENCTIQNLILKGSISCNVSGYVGAVSPTGFGVTFKNILSYINITNQSGAPTGGITGYLGRSDTREAVIDNCAVYADIRGTGTVGGLIGAGWDGNRSWTLTNSIFYGNVSGQEEKTGALVGYSETDNAAGIVIRSCYYPEGLQSIGGAENQETLLDQSCAASTETFASGEITSILNGGITDGSQRWYQTCGSGLPVWEGATVYAHSVGEQIVYTNAATAPEMPAEEEKLDTILEYSDAKASVTANTVPYRQDSYYYGVNGYDLVVAAGTISGKTTVSYQSGSTTVYLNPSGAAGDDLSEACVYAGNQNDGYTGGNRITMTGGTVSYLAGMRNGPDSSDVQNVVIVRTGGTVNSFIKGAHWAGQKTVYVYLYDTVGSGSVSYLGHDNTGFAGSIRKSGKTWTVNSVSLKKGIVPSGVTMTLASDETLVINAGITLENQGTIVNNGAAVSIGSNGKITNTGAGTVKYIKYKYCDIINCYYNAASLSAIGGAYTNIRTNTSDAKTAEQFASGEVCWLLNNKNNNGTGIWKQNLNSDPYPTFDGADIYGVEGTAANLYTDDSEYIRQVDGYYEIYTASQLIMFQQFVDLGNKSANGKLMNDINMSGKAWTPICITGLYYDKTYTSGTNYPDSGYAGIFDGNCHVIQNLSVSGSSGQKETYGLFGTISGTVKNLGVETFTFDLNGAADIRAGAVVGQNLGGTVSDCYAANVTIIPGDYVAGGLVGCNYAGTIENCHVYNSTISAGRFGWIVADNRADTDGDRVGTIQNCYTDGSKIVGTYTGTENDCQANVGSKFQSGEITYLLNGGRTLTGIWKQTINTKTYGTDLSSASDYPVFKGLPVYQMDSSAAKGYVNYEPPQKDSSGVYEIQTADNLMAFAQYVNLGSYGVDGRLTNDISMTAYAKQWIPIARTRMANETDYGYTGTFDGNGHTISNISFGITTDQCTNGLFGTVYNGGLVRHVGVSNLTFDDNTYDHRAAGIAGQLMYGGVIEDCFVTNSTIQASSRVVGGIAAMNLGTIKNCYTKGLTLAAHPNRFGGICGDYKGNTYSNHENGKVLNCYTDYAVIGSADSNNAGTMEDSECSIDDERFASGEIAYKLNQGREDDKAVWYQTLKTDTSSAFEGARVYYGYQDCRHSDAEYANTYLNSTAEHCYDTEPEFEWSEDYRACEAIFTCSLDSTHEKKEADCKIAEDTSDPEKTIYTASVTMQGNTYTDTQTPKNRVVSITMSWNEMEFDYTVGVWDAENHQYEEGIWSPTKEDGDVLTVTNNGTVELDISAYYEPIEDSEVKGSVTVKDSEAEGSVIVDDPESARFHLALGKQQELYLTLSGEMKKKTKHQQVGTIVLQLEESVSDTENAG